MRVLVACEFSGTVRDRFIAAGHEAMSCDLLETTTPGPHYTGDIRDLLASTAGYWDLMIAHPPCQFLSSSGLHWNKRPGYEWRQAETEKALEFVRFLLDQPIPKIVVENPRGCIGTRIRKANQVIHPYEFGDDASKETHLWLKGVKPLVKDPAMRFPGRWVTDPRNGKLVERWSNQTDSGQNVLGPSEDRWAIRSLTYGGIADAFVSWATGIENKLFVLDRRLASLTAAVEARCDT